MEDEEYTRDTLWRTYDGRELPIRELEDSHILNLLNYIGRKYDLAKQYLAEADPKDDIMLEIRQERFDAQESLLNVINTEIDLRGLDRNRVADGKSLPFKKDGRWMEWKKGDPRPTPIPNSIDFIKPIGEE
jgi:hypothetical protein